MKKLMISAACCAAFALFGAFPSINILSAQTADSVHNLSEISVIGARAERNTPVALSKLSRAEIDAAKTEVSLPYVIELTPSVVTSGENGKMGNTSFRLRGSDPTRINVNINGVTLNDAENQTVFWVNIPNLSGMAEQMQVQRGIGLSVGGTPSFGGTVNLQTANTSPVMHAAADMALGSFNTSEYGLQFGTGLKAIGRTSRSWGLDVAYNALNSDGFVRGGGCDHQSLFATAALYGPKSSLKAVVIIGKQQTGLTWNGAYDYELDADPTTNNAGLYFDAQGNAHFYDNETDNYLQRHYQLLYTRYLSERWKLTSVFDLTRGKGYYEEYLPSTDASWYGFANSILTDLVTQRYVASDAVTANLGVEYKDDALTASLAATALHYGARNYGDVSWVMDSNLVKNGLTPLEWYSNNSSKNDFSLEGKTSWAFSSRANVYADMQLRYIDYSINGPDDDFSLVDFHQPYLFFNPKAGVNFTPSEHSRVYLVAGITGREPTRSDVLNVLKNADTICAEHLVDVELGAAYNTSSFSLGANAYAMLYQNQLTPSGKLNNIGYALMVNVDRSYRMGVELEAGVKPLRWLSLDGNLTLSQNKILDYQYNDTINLGTTDLALSPNVIGAAMLTVEPVERLKFQLVGKYVGDQFADNTSRPEMLCEAYGVLNFKLQYTWNLKGGGALEAQLLVNNILNNQYRFSAWVADYGGGDIWRAYYQQPGTNFMARIQISM